MTEQNKKYLIYAAVAVAVATGGYFLLNKNDNSGVSQDPTGNGGYIPDNPATFDAKKVANELYRLMANVIVFRDEIFEVLRTVNQQQFGLVFTEFGKQKYNNFLGNNQEPLWTTLDKYDLAYWLKKEMGSDYQTLKLKYPQYL